MLNFPKYGRNIKRYADASFNSAWKEMVGLSVSELRSYHSDTNPDAPIAFVVKNTFGKSGLAGSVATRLECDQQMPDTALKLYPFWEEEYQRTEWHSHIYAACAMSWFSSKYMTAGAERPFYSKTDEELDRLENLTADDVDDFVQVTQASVTNMAARFEKRERASESNHARLNRIAATTKTG
jgi:hypothetical protein